MFRQSAIVDLGTATANHTCYSDGGYHAVPLFTDHHIRSDAFEPETQGA
jgi:hypothetical protein